MAGWGWGPDTPWRQGHILKAETAKKLGLGEQKEDGPETVAVVASHDCDLAHANTDEEPFVEVIVGIALPNLAAVRGSYTEAKHERRLHLTFTGGANELAADFAASGRSFIKKSDLVDDPAASVHLSGDERSVFQRWLALRYRRSTFPDEFNRRVLAVREKLGRVIDRTGPYLSGVFFSLDKNTDVDRKGEDDVYELTIWLVKNSEQDPDETTKAATRACGEINALFKGEFRKAGRVWKNVELAGCHPQTDDGMTLRESWRFREWRP